MEQKPKTEMIDDNLYVEKPAVTAGQRVVDKVNAQLDRHEHKMNHRGNPFNGMTFTEEERKAMTEAGIV